MEAEDKKYEKIVRLLKNSKPVLSDPEIVAEHVFSRLQKEETKVGLIDLIFYYLFGWTSIGWIRRSLVAVTVVIAVFFGYQQTIILRRIRDLSGQRIENGSLIMTGLKDDYAGKLQIFKYSGGKFLDAKANVSKKDVDDMIRSLNKLQVKYKDIINLIGDDPVLKKYIEEKMNGKMKN
jgi:hypothetical protein